jgi:ribosome maturation factor RimP
MSANTTRDRLLTLLAPIVTAQGLDLEDVTVSPAGRRRVVRVVVDRDGGVTLDHVAQVSRAISAQLDEQDVMGAGPYVLEVTSPGVDRPLTAPRHWHRAASRLVRTPLQAGGEVVGRVVRADESAVILDVDGVERAFSYAEIGPGRVQVEFVRADPSPEQFPDELLGELPDDGEWDGEQEKEAEEPWTST